MILKMLGAFLVVGASTAAGQLAAGNLARRPVELERFSLSLRLLETEIDYGTPLAEALNRTSASVGGVAARVLEEAASLLGAGQGLAGGEAWRMALENVYPGMALRRPDLEVLLDLSPFLGLSHRQDQLKHLEFARRRLAAQEAAARADEDKYLKLYRYLGFLGGLMVAVVLL